MKKDWKIVMMIITMVLRKKTTIRMMNLFKMMNLRKVF